ncbi:hypothetical protein N8E86_10030 [Avibacterium paragallinarum]|uniref:hypothetical protein n=1 Tax=Avibacterium paragallinarum TaxID=728 RepID=UPI0021F6B60F|nr:hypothetical protein [Avibacterium paragallinarum]UXN34379.1 hypothetical protein N8E86_10030 [Avibacterium paragallinarum]
MTSQNENYEIIKRVILNEQLGWPKKLKLIVVEESLSDEDKEQIKQAVLNHSASYGGRGVLSLAEELKDAFIWINA